jgi:hypothetical protein
MRIRCQACNGTKKIVGIGCVTRKCTKCDYKGTIDSSEKVPLKEFEPEPTVAEVIETIDRVCFESANEVEDVEDDVIPFKPDEPSNRIKYRGKKQSFSKGPS